MNHDPRAQAERADAAAPRSPLTDPRSLGGSLSFHLVLLLVASLVALGVAAPEPRREPTVLRAELDPVDNRAPASDQGGGPGELGGLGPPGPLRITSGADDPSGPAPDDRTLLDRLLAPADAPPAEPSDDSRAALPGATGVGVAPGPGRGGGGGAGGGSGGGTGPGLGPATVFFGTEERARSFAYAIDRSGSMSGHGSLNLAKRELLASLDQLPPDARFTVLFYNLEPARIARNPASSALEPATQANKEFVRAGLGAIDAEGGTNHARALRAAFAAGPEVVFLLTDGFHMNQELARRLRDEAGPIRIHVIEFGTGPVADVSGPVHELATATGGSYRYIDVLRYGRTNP